MGNSDIPVQEIGELLNMVSDKVPSLINGLMSSLYSAEAGRNLGLAVGNFYRALMESGIPEEDARTMTRDYMISIKGVMDSVKNSVSNG